MNFLYQLLEFLKSLLNWWFVVEPWEQAIRVRFGKNIKLFGPGLHVKMPFFDHIYGQNVRRRVLSLPLQTLTTSDGKVLTVEGSIGFRIDDVLKLHMTLHDAESAITQEVIGRVVEYVVRHPVGECSAAKIVDAVRATLKLCKYGLADVDFFLAGYVSDIPTFRLIQDGLAGNGRNAPGGYIDTKNTGGLAVAVPR